MARGGFREPSVKALVNRGETISSRYFAATQQFSCFRSEADIQQPRLPNRTPFGAPPSARRLRPRWGYRKLGGAPRNAAAPLVGGLG